MERSSPENRARPVRAVAPACGIDALFGRRASAHRWRREDVAVTNLHEGWRNRPLAATGGPRAEFGSGGIPSARGVRRPVTASTPQEAPLRLRAFSRRLAAGTAGCPIPECSPWASTERAPPSTFARYTITTGVHPYLHSTNRSGVTNLHAGWNAPSPLTARMRVEDT